MCYGDDYEVNRQGVFPIVHTGVFSVVLLGVKLVFTLEGAERARYLVISSSGHSVILSSTSFPTQERR